MVKHIGFHDYIQKVYQHNDQHSLENAIPLCYIYILCWFYFVGNVDHVQVHTHNHVVCITITVYNSNWAHGDIIH